ncbi:minor head protein [Ralstonia phage PQ43W]
MFQNQVYVNPANALPGDFASSNPMIYKLSATGKMIADASGVTIGKFAVLNADGTVTSVPGAAPSSTTRIGFVHREMNAQITAFLAENGYTIAKGMPVALFGTGDFWVNADVVSGSPARGTAILWDTVTGNTNIGGTVSATLIATGYSLVDESASVGGLVRITNTGA